jgi:hypothetical protein
VEDEMGGACRMKGGEEEHRLLVGESQRVRDHYEYHDVGGWIILRWILKRQNVVLRTGLVWLRIGTSGELL